MLKCLGALKLAQTLNPCQQLILVSTITWILLSSLVPPCSPQRHPPLPAGPRQPLPPAHLQLPAPRRPRHRGELRLQRHQPGQDQHKERHAKVRGSLNNVSALMRSIYIEIEIVSPRRTAEAKHSKFQRARPGVARLNRLALIAAEAAKTLDGDNPAGEMTNSRWSLGNKKYKYI